MGIGPCELHRPRRCAAQCHACEGPLERRGSRRLRGPGPISHPKHDDYRQIRDTYRLKARALEKAAANDPLVRESA